MSENIIIGFICKTCKKELALGTCGDHREETMHKEFREVYENIIPSGKEHRSVK